MSNLKSSSIHFTNPFADYVGKFNGEEFLLPGGQSTYLTSDLACHFAKHLVNRELHGNGKETSDPSKHEVIKKISPTLSWKEGKHLVKVDAEAKVEVSPAREKLDLLDAITDPSSEVQQPVAPQTSSETPTVEVQVEAVPQMEKTRNQLNEEAFKLGIGKTKVLQSPNKAAVIALINSAGGK